MTVDERIEKLTERHEALAQSVEVLSADVRRQSRNIDKLVTAMADLISIARMHDRRISHLEAGH